ncbi:CGNR zinc finger domain-containing protein [Hamadaea sp. NPDC051192]|uniref:CGNR zinc finger domain-containing protein n=1 Tax=Hamadaea sp. NPDC051192 TaxID=3154940 RepID=UPI0034127745
MASVIQPGDRAPAPPGLALVQDLINTVDLEMDRDALRTVGGLVEFCADHDVPLSGLTESDLRAVLELREALRDVCQAHAGVDVPAATVSRLDKQLAQAHLVLAIDESGTALVRPAAGLTGAVGLTAHIASSIAGAVADDTWRRLKACAADTCRWAYYDHSPAGRSRWCTMSICGARNKMRRLRSRASAPAG